MSSSDPPVVLARPGPSHKQRLLDIMNAPQLDGRRYLPARFDRLPMLDASDVDDVINCWRTADKAWHFAILEGLSDGDGKLLGYAGCGWGWDPHCPWIHVVIDPSRWRLGYGSAAFWALSRRLFHATVAHNISNWIRDWNVEGLGFAQAVGFTDCGRARRAYLRSGRFGDEVLVDMLRPQWQNLALTRED